MFHEDELYIGLQMVVKENVIEKAILSCFIPDEGLVTYTILAPGWMI